MTWTVYGDSYDTDSDLSNGTKSIRVKFNTAAIVTFIRTWVVFVANPGLTTLTMKIYSDNNGSKGTLLYSSTTSHTKAQILTKRNGINELYFQFNNISFDSSNWYHIVLVGTSTGLSTTSHIAWKNSYPNPVYTTNIGNPNIDGYPYICSCIGAEF